MRLQTARPGTCQTNICSIRKSKKRHAAQESVTQALHQPFCILIKLNSSYSLQPPILPALGRPARNPLPPTRVEPAADQSHQGHVARPPRQTAETVARARERCRPVQTL